VKNIWFQLLHNRINTRVVTHRYVPHIVQSPLYPLCTPESLQIPEHMFIFCQRVWQIWKKSFMYIFPRQTRLHLLSPHSSSSYYLPPAFFFGSILEAIWLHYWRFIFGNVPFVPDHVVNTVNKIYSQYLNRANLDDFELRLTYLPFSIV
ncbi:hypothetical protein BD770DRAFT_331013, partial [Pilaira anomala]